MGNLIDIKTIVDSGFLLYLSNSKYIVEKRPGTLNRREAKDRSFERIEDAISFINEIINLKEWKPIIRYNRGLGVEYRTLSVIIAPSLEEAKKKALEEAEKTLGDYIIEVKVIENF